MDINALRSEFAVDPCTGQLYRKGRKVGYLNKNGYFLVKIKGRSAFAHRVVWALTHGEWPQLDIDHINGVRSDNRPENLRHVARSLNCQNKGAALSTNDSTGLLGANHHASNGRGFRAQIWFDGKNHHLGYFQTPEEAHSAYLEAKRRVHPGFIPERFVACGHAKNFASASLSTPLNKVEQHEPACHPH